jgi:serine/threonine-protein kinase
MKRCPECRRNYYDDSLSYCLDDGVPLLDGPAATAAEQNTMVFPGIFTDSPRPVSYDSQPETAILHALPVPPADARNSIAVLPLVNVSADAENEYFCDGLAEELINSLARVDDLKVVARTSAFSFKGKNIDIAQIGSILNVKNILEGSVRKFGERMRISVNLVNATDGYHIWSEKYDTGIEDIFDVQDKIARSVVNNLKTKLLGEKDQGDDDRMTILIEDLKHHARDVGAYQLYLRGRFFLNKFSTDNFYRALECFNEALAIDPDFAEAYAGLADTHAMLTEMGPVAPHEAMPRAKEAALKALSINEHLSEAHSSLGLVLQDYDHDFTGAEQEFRRAIELNPNNSAARQFYGQLLAQLGRHEEAEAEFQRALEVDPLSVIGHWIYGFGLFEARRYDDCLEQSRKALELDSNFPAAFLNLAFAHHMKGEYAESVEAYAKFSELCGAVETADIIRESFASGGWEGFLRKMTDPDGPVKVSDYIVAVYHAALGNKDGAINKLQASFQAREPYIVMIKIDPRFDAVRDDTRFQELLLAVGFPG